MKLSRRAGATSQIFQLFIQNNSVTTGAGLTGLTSGSSGLIAYFHRDTDTTATAISLTTMTSGTFTSSGFVEVDSTHMPGVYQFCPPNTAMASGASSVVIMLSGATNMAPVVLEIDLDTQVDVYLWNGTAVSSPATAGIPDVNVKNMNNVAATSITTINANQGTTQPLNFTGTAGSALVKSDMTDIAGAAVSATTAQIGVNVVNWNNTVVATPATAGIPDINVKNINNVAAATPGASGGILISGSNAGTTTLAALTVTGSMTVSDGLLVARSTSNASAITATGNGTGHGAVFTSGSGATGDGVQMTAASTNGNGFNILGKGTGNGILATSGTGSGASGLNCVGSGVTNVTTGAKFSGGKAGDGITCVGGQALPGAQGGNGLTLTAGASTISSGATAGIGLSITGGAASATVNPAGSGVVIAAGALAGAGGASGFTVTGTGAFSGAVFTSGTGATGDGVQMTAASTNGNGLSLTHAGSGVDLNGQTTNSLQVDVRKILGTASAGTAGYVGIDWAQIANPTATVNLSNTTIATLTGQLTAAQIATGVWQDTTSGDFTVASSIGKSLYTSGVVPGGAGGLFIAGSNAGTTVNFTGNLSGSVGSVTGAVGSVTGSVGSVVATVNASVTQWNGVNVIQSVPIDATFIRSGTAQGGGATSITLDSGASATNNLYQNETIFIRSGTGAGQSNIIVSYVGSTKVATVATAWATNPDNTSVFTILADGPSISSVSGTVNANVTQWAGTNVATPATAGIPEVNVKNVNNVSASSVSTINANLGTTTALTFDANGYVKVDVVDIAGATTVGSPGYVGIDWAHINAPTSSVSLSGTTISTSQVVASVSGAVGSVTGNVGGNVTGSVGSVSGNVGGNVTGSVGSVVATVNASVTQWNGVNVTQSVPIDATFIRSGTAQGGGASTITLDSGASATDNLYQNEIVFIRSGTGAGQSNIISSYVGATKVATVATAWATAPNNTSVFTVMADGPSAATVTGTINANVTQIAGQTASAAAGVTFPSSIASPTNITAGTITTTTNLTNAPTNGDFTAAMKTSLNAATPASVVGAVGSVSGNVGGNVVGSVGSVAGNVSGSVASVVGAVGSVAGNVGGNVNGSIGSLSSTAQSNVASAAWNATLASFLTPGSTGFALNAAGSAGDPWSTAIPGAYAAGTAGYLVGNKFGLAITAGGAVAIDGTSALAEVYPAAGQPMTLAGALYSINQQQGAVSIPAGGTTRTVFQRNGTTPAMTFTINSSTAPTAVSQTT